MVTLEDRVATEIAWWHLHGGNLGTQTKKIIDMCESDRAPLLSVLRQCVEALSDYMAQFGQGLEAHDISFGPAQKSVDEKARAALSAAAPYLERKEGEG
jgi:hypothetical protein